MTLITNVILTGQKLRHEQQTLHPILFTVESNSQSHSQHDPRLWLRHWLAHPILFATYLLGHGKSDGLRCYLGDMEKIAGSSLSFFLHIRNSEPYKLLPAFLFDESMGGATAVLMYFQSPPDAWMGLIFSAPLFVMPENMKPSKVRLIMYGMLFGITDTWAAMPDNKMVGKAIKDPKKLKIIASNPRRYTREPRVGTIRELARVCQCIQDNFDR